MVYELLTVRRPLSRVGRERMRAREIAMFTRLVAALERRVAAALKPEFVRVGHALVAAFEEPGDRHAAVDTILAEHRERVERILRAQLLMVAIAMGSRIIDGTKGVRGAIERKDAEGDWLSRIKGWLAGHAANTASRVTGALAKRITRIAEQPDAEPHEVAVRIRVVALEGAAARAEAVAQHQAQTAATVSTQEAAASIGLELDKEWGTAEDDKVRPTHAAASGQRVGMDETFTVGGAQLRFPCDPEGPPEETINCRCVSLYWPKDA